MAGWIELLAGGLTFDCSGLMPTPSAPLPPRGHDYALDHATLPARIEAVTLVPGPHLAGGESLLPVIRALAVLGAALAALPGVVAVAWHPARSWVEPQFFARAIADWLDGGPFPALGLTALSLVQDGGLHSEGLAFLIGQELRIEPDDEGEPADAAKLAVRLIHHLVERGPIRQAQDLAGPWGAALRVEPSINGRYLRVWRRR